MKKYETRHYTLVLAIFGIAVVTSAAFAGTSPTVPAVPEPTGALLFAAGIAVAAIFIRMIRRK